ncbi:hypothetical protein AB6N23_10505, partial [Cellulomonas sp. 179-A 9B4 NHS]|uniref:hypothetical protein n=1 Tax=Cellulomonas sp. 179-A 9B4 NHS TaxID=3142379 RepID=UPI00399FD92D
APRWPALAAAAWVGTFCAVAGTMLVRDVLLGGPGDDRGVVALAIGLRLVTVAAALASVQAWGRRVPGWVLLGGLWGIAAVQIAYPLAETVVKGAILAGVMDPVAKGISDMSATGWFTFGMTWLIWGVPGVLFGLAARSYARRTPVPRRWVVIGALGGLLFLAALGLLIG